MAKRMLIDAAHPEETRVVVLNGSRLEEFDFETSTKKQIKGNIYLAKVTRVEPSLQAAFVEYGGNRHGFLAFSEIHPDYYRIPVADRQAALAAERAAEHAANAREEARERTQAHSHEADDHDGHDHEGHDHEDHDHEGHDHEDHDHEDHVHGGHNHEEHDHGEHDDFGPAASEAFQGEEPDDEDDDHRGPERMAHAAPSETIRAPEPEFEPELPLQTESESPPAEFVTAIELTGEAATSDPSSSEPGDGLSAAGEPVHVSQISDAVGANGDAIETVGGDEIEEATRSRVRPFRHYKIQEVIKRRQIMLVQVVKEERGNKGAALTTYLSLAGRYCVLMPNTPRGGGVSRKITNNVDRRRLKELMSDLDVPEGMGVIVRTAGSERSKTEIKRDLEYLLRLWDEIRDLTLKSTAPALIYEEGNLIKRSIRDLYARDIEEVVVDGEEGYRTAKAFMKMLMPSHAKRVKPYRDPSVPLFHRFQVEGQLDAIHSPVVQLRSGGYLVINPTEALVAIDVNSGRSTKERNIEETALKTNVEAAEELARQLRLRDLAGLVVIDFIDMEEYRNRSTVERRLKDAMRFDRARIQLGRISPFGLLELSRQRLRSSLVEASTQTCPHCNGTGVIRSIESTALHVLRGIEEEGMRRRSAEIGVTVPPRVALYILNQKRAALQLAEARFGFKVMIDSDETLVPPAFRLERLRALTPAEIAALPIFVPAPPDPEDEDDTVAEEEELIAAEPEEAPAERDGGDGDEDGHGHRRRRRRRGWREEGAERETQPAPAEAPPPIAAAEDDEIEPETVEVADAASASEPRAAAESGSEAERKRRRRGRRGGRRRRRENGGPERHNGASEHPEPGNGFGDQAAASGLDEPEDIEVGDSEDAPEAETIELVPPEPHHEPASREVAEAFTATPAPPEAAHATASVPVADEGDTMPDADEPEHAPSHYQVPPPQGTNEPPANPRRGWWRR